MYQITYFGQNASGTGSIRSLLSQLGIDVGTNQPYVNGVQTSLDDTPAAGSTVTFRPPASGKARGYSNTGR